MSKRSIWKEIRRRTKKIRHLFIYAGVVLLKQTLLLLPPKWGIRFGGGLGKVAYFLVFWERRRALENLRLAFASEKSEKELRYIARQVFVNAARSLAEMFYLLRLDAEYLKRHITLQGKNYFTEAYQQGKGSIALTAHLGNWELMGAFFSQVEKNQFAVVARELSNKYLDRMLMESRRRWGVEAMPRGKTSTLLLSLLRGKQTIGILADQDTKGEGIFVNFFGRPAYTQIGPAWLALRCQVPLIPVFIVRHHLDPLQHTIYIEPPLLFELTSDLNANIRLISQLFTEKIESYVRRFPEQWMWIHRRWKTQPGKISKQGA